ncbi:Rho guanine nucleotide exchange factor 16 [Saguinus oedipus]|uniref:Rho guanine nucleotide exchange factor 16 n=1 Tax=Saguinus oedipus TaxID=9490 RepID=A0ABQ9V907_SAGOE|nr:Rho guanine nucleotide exchange factor 16 [Saguinus oedipus]
MSQRHSDSSLEEKLLEYRFHSELRLDASGNPASGLPMVRGSLRVRDNAAFQPEAPAPPGHEEPRPIILSTESPAALKLGTQQLIPKGLAVASKSKTPARHQSFGAAVLSREAARRNPQLLPAASFSLDDMDVDTDPGGMLRRNLRNQSYRAAMKGLGKPGGQGDAIQLSPKLQALAEEPTQPATRSPARHKKTLGRKRGHKGSFKDDPQFYQEIQERGLNTSQESDDDILDEPSSPEGGQKADATIVVKSYRPAQVTWSQLPEVMESGILEQLSTEERKRQEGRPTKAWATPYRGRGSSQAMFEILTSEFSYQHSLSVLVTEFLQSQELRATMTQTEHHHLFSNIRDVLNASQRKVPHTMCTTAASAGPGEPGLHLDGDGLGQLPRSMTTSEGPRGHGELDPGPGQVPGYGVLVARKTWSTSQGCSSATPPSAIHQDTQAQRAA